MSTMSEPLGPTAPLVLKQTKCWQSSGLSAEERETELAGQIRSQDPTFSHVMSEVPLPAEAETFPPYRMRVRVAYAAEAQPG